MKIILFLVSVITISLFLGYFTSIEGFENPDIVTFSREISNNNIVEKIDINTKSITTFSCIFYNIFNKSNIIILFWFLSIYYILFSIFKISNQTENISMSKFFDIVVFCIVVLYSLIIYLCIPSQNQETILENIGIAYLNYLNDPYSIFSLSLFIFVFYLILFFFSIPLQNDKSLVISIVESVAWITVALLIIIDFFKYLLGIPILDDVKNWISSACKIIPQNLSDNPVNPVNPLDLSFNTNASPEVFHISDNIYTYDDAQAVCSSYGATLANYNQINDYYNNGGEFCSYGWSADQMALFPTQESTWKKIQNSKNKINNVCGRPGINGGIFDSDYKFGVNCFGIKPPPTAEELVKLNNNVTIPQTPDQKELQNKINYFKSNACNMNISSFNNTKWSKWSDGATPLKNS